MIGSETEFGIFNGWSDLKARRVQEAVTRYHAHLPSAKAGVFLPNGARVYLDLRLNEYATPEVNSPTELVCHELAGRAIMAKAAAAHDMAMLCSNVDPLSNTTWGTHENYESKGFFTKAQLTQLYTHLVTRVVFTGAGGLDLYHPGIRPILSPRADAIVASMNHQGRSVNRSLVFIKPEDYCSGHRLHVMCGESLLSHTASFLKYGTTALVAQCIQNEQWVCPTLRESPIKVLRNANRDLSMGLRYRLQDGRALTVLEIQREILDGVERNLASLPDWATDVVTAWDAILSTLESDNVSRKSVLDWQIFATALDGLTRDYGYSNEDLRLLNRSALEYARGGKRSPRLNRFEELCAAAKELYVRLHIVGDGSLFNVLEKDGWVDHHLADINDDSIMRAMHEPPSGRAANRAMLIKKYGKQFGFKLSWDALHDCAAGSLHIPTQPNWNEPENWRREVNEIEIVAHTASAAFRQGRYHDVLKQLLDDDGQLRVPESQANAEMLLLSCGRLGMVAETESALDLHTRLSPDPFYAAGISVSAVNNLGLCPPVDKTMQYILLAERALNDCTPDSYPLYSLNQYKARLYTQLSRVDEAIFIFDNILSSPDNCSRTRMTARTCCFYSEALRRAGRVDRARELLASAIDRHLREDMMGDLADHSLPMQAKLVDDMEAAECLRRAEILQRRLKNKLGLARVLCLKARRLKIASDLDEIRALSAELPALQTCALAKRIVTNWFDWVNGGRGNGPIDYCGL